MLWNLFGVIVLFCLTVIFFLSWILSQVILRPRTGSSQEIMERLIREKRMTREYFDALEQREFEIASKFGYMLSCLLLQDREFEREKKKLVILCHGYTMAKLSMISYAKIFLSLGYLVLLYDHRNHGESGKIFTSMGYYESKDLETVLDYCFDYYGKDLKVITFGESMGAATVLLNLKEEERLCGVIADCGYSNLKGLLKHQLKNRFHLPPYPFIFIADFLFWLRGRFRLDQVCPMEAVKNSHIPVFFIHGATDLYVPTKMSEEMYQQKKGKKKLYLCEGAAHAKSIVMDEKEYDRQVKEFLKEIGGESL